MKFCVITNKREYSCEIGVDACLFLHYDMKQGEYMESVTVVGDDGSEQRFLATGGGIRQAQMFINRCSFGVTVEEKDIPKDVQKDVLDLIGSDISRMFSIAGRVFVEIKDCGSARKEEIQFLLGRIDWGKYGLFYDPGNQFFDCRLTLCYTDINGRYVPVNAWNSELNYERLHYFGGKYPTSATHTLSSVVLDGLNKKDSYDIGDDVLFGSSGHWISGQIRETRGAHSIDGKKFSTDRVKFYPMSHILCLYEGVLPDLDFLIGAKNLTVKE